MIWRFSTCRQTGIIVAFKLSVVFTIEKKLRHLHEESCCRIINPNSVYLTDLVSNALAVHADSKSIWWRETTHYNKKIYVKFRACGWKIAFFFLSMIISSIVSHYIYYYFLSRLSVYFYLLLHIRSHFKQVICMAYKP